MAEDHSPVHPAPLNRRRTACCPDPTQEGGMSILFLAMVWSYLHCLAWSWWFCLALLTCSIHLVESGRTLDSKVSSERVVYIYSSAFKFFLFHSLGPPAGPLLQDPIHVASSVVPPACCPAFHNPFCLMLTYRSHWSTGLLSQLHRFLETCFPWAVPSMEQLESGFSSMLPRSHNPVDLQTLYSDILPGQAGLSLGLVANLNVVSQMAHNPPLSTPRTLAET